MSFVLLALLLFAGQIAAYPEADLPSTVVFEQGLGNVSCYRIPAITRTDKGTLVAFAEARHGSCGDGDVHEIAYRRSEDNGATWSPIRFAAGNASFWVGNPVATFDSQTGKIVLAMVKHASGCTGGCGRGNAVAFSSDDGLTFELFDVSVDFGPASGSLPGPGPGLQLQHGPAAGRLLVVSHHGAYQRDYVTISDDGGQNWHTVGATFPKMDEAIITELSNGTVLLNMRHQAEPKMGRGIASSDDGGLTWSEIRYDANLLGPVCQASMVSFGGATYFSNPDSTSGRHNISVRRSVDNTASWGEKTVLVLAESSAGYSCLVQEEMPNGTGGILFEGTNATIAFSRFSLSAFE